MYNPIKNNNTDAFSESIRQKLKGHQIPAPPTAWDTIASGVNAAKPKKKFASLWWFTTGIAAAIALFFVVKTDFNQHENTLAIAKKPTAKQTSIENAIAKTVNLEATTITTENTKTISQNTKQISNQNTTINSTITITDKSKNINIPNNQIAVNNIEPTKEIDIESTKNTVSSKINNRNSDTAQSTPKAAPTEKLQLKKEDWSDPLKEKNSRQWELVAMVGSAGSSSNNTLSAPTLDYMPRAGIVAVESASTYIFAPEDFTSKSYLAPVSVGAAIAYSISKSTSIQSGLTYTYLVTSFDNNTVDSKLHLHYVGLPLRIIYNFSQTNKWSFYGSVGTMIEKGIWSVYVQNQNYPNSTITTTVTDKIKGWQYSVNSSVGTAYNIQKNTAIYFEPKISYYFDSNQPISIRTENKLVIGFEGGLRYKF